MIKIANIETVTAPAALNFMAISYLGYCEFLKMNFVLVVCVFIASLPGVVESVQLYPTSRSQPSEKNPRGLSIFIFTSRQSGTVVSDFDDTMTQGRMLQLCKQGSFSCCLCCVNRKNMAKRGFYITELTIYLRFVHRPCSAEWSNSQTPTD